MFAEVIAFDPEEYKARRSRLGIGSPNKPAPRLLLAAPEPFPVAVEREKEPEGYVPLNMLAPPSWKFLLAYACRKHKVTQKAVLSHRRNRELVNARFEAVSLVYSHLNASLPQIGKWFNRDHTSILHMLRATGARQMEKPLPVEHKSAPRPQVEKVEAPKPPKKPNGATALQQAVKRAYASGVSALDVAEAYGASVKSIHVIAHRLGLEHPSYRRNK